jgi:hypothetical protein
MKINKVFFLKSELIIRNSGENNSQKCKFCVKVVSHKCAIARRVIKMTNENIIPSKQK